VKGIREEVATSNRRMATLLEQVTARLDPAETPYLNRQRAAHLQAVAWEQLPPEEQLEGRLRLSLELLRAGATTESLDQLALAWPLLEEHRPADVPLRWLLHQSRAIAYLRLAEQENCSARHTSESCLLPIREAGVHTVPRGCREALRDLQACLRLNPKDRSARWLLNVAHMALGEYPDGVPLRWRIPPQAFASEAELPRFQDVAPEAGVAVVGLSGGAIVEDLTGDDRLDIFCSSWGVSDPLRFFENAGDGTFVDRTGSAGLKGIVGGLNLCHADYDNDGRRDILVLRGAWLSGQTHFPNSLLRNRGSGVFEDVTERAGLLSFHPTQTAAWGDYNGDGWLDLFIGNETLGDEAHPCELFHNNGDGTFTECAARLGLAVTGFVKGAAWGDYDNDGRPDLYVSVLGAKNLLFRNEGSSGTDLDGDATSDKELGAVSKTRRPARAVVPWKFVNRAAAAGVEQPIDSFPLWFWDHDNDGWLDLFVAAYTWETAAGDVAADYLGLENRGAQPRLYRNRGDGTFADVTKASGWDRVLIAMGANHGDLDGDGFQDAYIGTGEPHLGAIIPNRMFKNIAGQRFADVTTAGGFGHLQKGHGVAFGDLDGDGDQDLYCVLGGAYEGDTFQNALFRNPGTNHRWITLALEGTLSNRDAIGARIEVEVERNGRTRRVHALVGTGGSFGSSSLQQEIGLGDATSIRHILLRWPSGRHERFRGIKLDQRVTLREGTAPGSN